MKGISYSYLASYGFAFFGGGALAHGGGVDPNEADSMRLGGFPVSAKCALLCLVAALSRFPASCMLPLCTRGDAGYLPIKQ